MSAFVRDAFCLHFPDLLVFFFLNQTGLHICSSWTLQRCHLSAITIFKAPVDIIYCGYFWIMERIFALTCSTHWIIIVLFYDWGGGRESWQLQDWITVVRLNLFFIKRKAKGGKIKIKIKIESHSEKQLLTDFFLSLRLLCPFPLEFVLNLFLLY